MYGFRDVQVLHIPREDAQLCVRYVLTYIWVVKAEELAPEGGSGQRGDKGLVRRYHYQNAESVRMFVRTFVHRIVSSLCV